MGIHFQHLFACLMQNLHVQIDIMQALHGVRAYAGA